MACDVIVWSEVINIILILFFKLVISAQIKCKHLLLAENYTLHYNYPPKVNKLHIYNTFEVRLAGNFKI